MIVKGPPYSDHGGVAVYGHTWQGVAMFSTENIGYEIRAPFFPENQPLQLGANP
jgi:hypothetical protein